MLCAPQRSIVDHLEIMYMGAVHHLEITCGLHQSENGLPEQSGDET